MKATINTILELNKEEAKALKRLLGTMTKSKKTELGLTDKQCEIISEIYCLLPDTVE